MRCLLVLTGESFRLGNQTSRGRSDSVDATNRQKLATYSHLRLVNYIKKTFDTDTDVFINSYTLNPTHDAMLLDWYKPHIVYSNFYNSIFPSENDFMDATNKQISAMNLSIYDFIIFVRIDIYIKSYFLTCFTTIDNTLRYAHIDFNHGGICHNVIYVPKCYVELINAPIDVNFRAPHYGRDFVIKTTPDISIDYFIRSYHSLSTDLNWNPLYSQVGRNESFHRENIGERYVNNNRINITNDNEYDHLLHTDTIEENLKALEDGTFDVSLN